MSIVRVLMADAPLPSPGYGSWAQRMSYLLQEYPHNVFDYLICHTGPGEWSSQRTRRITCQPQPSPVLNRLWPHYRFRQHLAALQRIAATGAQLHIGILDSIRLKHAVYAAMQRGGWAHRCQLTYYQCGYSTYLPSDKFNAFAEGIDQLIYLTRHSYLYELEHNPALPFRAAVLPNPIDHRRYYVPSPDEKAALRQRLGWGPGLHLLWSSQNRKKKGLDVVLAAWRRFYASQPQATLHVVGASLPAHEPGVCSYGAVPNYEVAPYVLAADVGLFSPLWTEGFGLSLAEQMSSGLYCIASWVGGVKDYFQPGVHGLAIDTPNMPEAWEAAMQQVYSMHTQGKLATNAGSGPLFLTYDEWCERFCGLF